MATTTKRYHISKAGKTAVCKAPPGECPLGGTHFSSKAVADFYLETHAPTAPAQPDFTPGQLELLRDAAAAARSDSTGDRKEADAIAAAASKLPDNPAQLSEDDAERLLLAAEFAQSEWGGWRDEDVAGATELVEILSQRLQPRTQPNGLVTPIGYDSSKVAARAVQVGNIVQFDDMGGFGEPQEIVAVDIRGAGVRLSFRAVDAGADGAVFSTTKHPSIPLVRLTPFIKEKPNEDTRTLEDLQQHKLKNELNLAAMSGYRSYDTTTEEEAVEEAYSYLLGRYSASSELPVLQRNREAVRKALAVQVHNYFLVGHSAV